MILWCALSFVAGLLSAVMPLSWLMRRLDAGMRDKYAKAMALNEQTLEWLELMKEHMDALIGKCAARRPMGKVDDAR